MHEENFWLIEKEMIVERGHAQPVINRCGHRGIDFVFEKNGVAHDHGAVLGFGE